MRAFIVGLILSAPGQLIACTTVRGPLDIPRQADAAAARANALGIAHYKLGEDEMGHWIVAKGYFEDAIKADPMLAEPHYNLALTLDKLGEHTEATIHFKRAGELAQWNTTITGSEPYRRHVTQRPNASSGAGY